MNIWASFFPRTLLILNLELLLAAKLRFVCSPFLFLHLKAQTPNIFSLAESTNACEKKFEGSWKRTQHVSITSRLCLLLDHHNSPSMTKLHNIRIILSEHVYVFFITEAKFIQSSVLKIMLDFNCSIQHEWYHKTDQQGNAPFHPTRFVPSYSRPIKIPFLQK